MLLHWATVGALVGLAMGCGFPGAPAHSTVTFSTDSIGPGTVATYSCDRGFELLGPARKECQGNTTWTPAGIPFCVINVAAGKAPMQSSTAQGGIPQKAVDGSTSGFFNPKTCTLTEQETSPLWYVNLLEPYMVQLVRLDFGRSCCENNVPATVVVRVGNNRPDLKINPICNRFTGFLEEGRPLFLPCNPPMPGAFISVHLEGPAGQMLSICEAFVYTDQALPIERCPQFRDQPPGSTATYNGKCYTFYNQQPQTFSAAQEFCQSRGGTLIDETNPALQGFLSWELWRRHREDPNGQYWMGAVRDPQNPANWKWITGQDLGVSFWSLPGGQENCARFDGTKDWLWSDTNCNLQLNFICQHQPLTCGKPEQPPNSTLVAPNFNVGSKIAYRCEDGHLLSGPEERECLSTGFYSAYPPTCKNLQCGMPAEIRHGRYSLVNSTRGYLSMVVYECDQDFVMVGRNELICDVDERWSGPPPRCEPVFCKEPPAILNGGFRVSTNSTIVGTLVEYYCLDDRFTLSGPRTLRCMRDGTYNQEPPVCRETKLPTTDSSETFTVTTAPPPSPTEPDAYLLALSDSETTDDPLALAASNVANEFVRPSASGRRRLSRPGRPRPRPRPTSPVVFPNPYDEPADDSTYEAADATSPAESPTTVPPYTVLPGDRVLVKDVQGEKRRKVFIFRQRTTTPVEEGVTVTTYRPTIRPTTAPTEWSTEGDNLRPGVRVRGSPTERPTERPTEWTTERPTEEPPSTAQSEEEPEETGSFRRPSLIRTRLRNGIRRRVDSPLRPVGPSRLERPSRPSSQSTSSDRTKEEVTTSGDAVNGEDSSSSRPGLVFSRGPARRRRPSSQSTSSDPTEEEVTTSGEADTGEDSSSSSSSRPGLVFSRGPARRRRPSSGSFTFPRRPSASGVRRPSASGVRRPAVTAGAGSETRISVEAATVGEARPTSPDASPVTSSVTWPVTLSVTSAETPPPTAAPDSAVRRVTVSLTAAGGPTVSFESEYVTSAPPPADTDEPGTPEEREELEVTSRRRPAGSPPRRRKFRPTLPVRRTSTSSQPKLVVVLKPRPSDRPESISAITDHPIEDVEDEPITHTQQDIVLSTLGTFPTPEPTTTAPNHNTTPNPDLVTAPAETEPTPPPSTTTSAATTPPPPPPPRRRRPLVVFSRPPGRDTPPELASPAAGDTVAVAAAPGVISFGRPEENEIPDTVNIRQNAPGVSEPANTLDERSTGPRLHMGGIIALSVFGGFVFLAAVVTTIVILIRRNRGYSQRRGTHANANSSSYSTDTETHGLNKYYKRAWENLQSSGRHDGKAGGGKSRGAEPTMRSEMYRDASELTVADVAHMYRGGDDKRRHHHHHHRHHKDERGDRSVRHARN